MTEDKTKFNLRRDMSPEAILRELHGRTSGETAQELQYFMGKTESKQFDTPSHQVMVKEGYYALFVKRLVSTDAFGNDSIAIEYYLAGINDEGKYFVHTLGDVAKNFGRPPTMAGLLNWVNRDSDGAGWKRIQGDVLMCFRSYESESMEMTIQQMNASTNLRVFEFPGTKYGLSLYSTRGLALKLGRHILTTDGRIELEHHILEDTDRKVDESLYFSKVDTRAPVVAVLGNVFTLIHPEHAPISVEIPHNKFALLTGQRGRSFSVDVTSTNIPLLRGFD